MVRCEAPVYPPKWAKMRSVLLSLLFLELPDKCEANVAATYWVVRGVTKIMGFSSTALPLSWVCTLVCCAVTGVFCCTGGADKVSADEEEETFCAEGVSGTVTLYFFNICCFTSKGTRGLAEVEGTVCAFVICVVVVSSLL